MASWVIDDAGCAGAILDEFCLRNLAGHNVGWVFGLSVFSLAGEHIGWYEDGLFYDIENNVLGFIPGAKGVVPERPEPCPPSALPAFSKRPCVPALRGRTPRPLGTGWSGASLDAYLAAAGAPAVICAAMPPHARLDGRACPGSL
ncbi:4-fold beta flower protein [Massilia sp. TSP1-1-2]|uniref:4-fold beta flower protein n=1 Tax=unclassified Massilia TaxID=2609279 RepID=UPI003CF3A339